MTVPQFRPRLVAFWIVLVCGISPGGAPFLPPVTDSRTSVILISVDTLRADRLSCYGYHGLQTSAIDALTERGTLFSQVTSQVPLTLPSHVSLFTSTYPFVNGIEDNGQRLGPHVSTLATVLKSRGYRTAAFVGGFVLDGRFGLNQGFDVYSSSFDFHEQEETNSGDVKRPGEEVVRDATKWLAENSSEPFFVFLHLYDLHTPYNLPLATRHSFHSSGYEAELEYVNRVLGSFWDFLVQRGLWEKTLLVFISDHGEGLGEHGEDTHGSFIYQSTVRVPLIFHWPTQGDSFPERVDEPVSLMDVSPTILEFLGSGQLENSQGRSLLGLLKQESPDSGREVYTGSLYAHNHFGCSGLSSLRVGRYKYTEAPKPEFYDLAQDPNEKTNLYPHEKALALTFRERLLSLRGRFNRAHGSDPSALTAEDITKLGSLGYVAPSSTYSKPGESGPDPKDLVSDFKEFSRSRALASSGKFSEANTLLKRLLRKRPELLDVRIALGVNMQKLGQHRNAVENFRRVLKADPTNIQAHFDLATSYFALHQFDEAIKEADATLAIAPYYTRAEELLGSIFFQRKEYDQARAHFTSILMFAPDDYAAHFNLGVLAIMESQLEEGESQLRLALRAYPQSAEAHNAWGSLCFRRGDLEGARLEFAKSIQLQHNFAQAHYNLALVFLKQMKNDEAARELHLALAANPQLSAARDELNRLKDTRE
jgi:choline-sulfatase